MSIAVLEAILYWLIFPTLGFTIYCACVALYLHTKDFWKNI